VLPNQNIRIKYDNYDIALITSSLMIQSFFAFGPGSAIQEQRHLTLQK